MRTAVAAAILGSSGLLACGCNSLPPGPVQAVATRPALARARAGEVYLLRGWRGLWSEGIDALCTELQSAGLDATVFRAEQAAALADALLQRYGDGRTVGPLVLIGFSYGADDAIEVAEKLNARGVAVDLLVTIDPVTPPAVPPNVRACRNYYEPNGAWDALPWLRGIPLHEAASDSPSPGGRVVNINVRQTPGVADPGTSHARIAADPRLHAVIVKEVLGATRPLSPEYRGKGGGEGPEAPHCGTSFSPLAYLYPSARR